MVYMTYRPFYTRGGKKTSTHEIGDWVSPKAGVDVLEKRGISYP
jgi:hypothetical protein